ncbi:hypothetical protein QE417_003343 [Mucilaginibacter terrae]|uniref:Uncharacterized protein n=1 Tax=Mucilaginibacter terrae TaxID=1955052 RepID=A0ABU3GXW5_9SPHI|nr:hypothetical protein [Mucilaginibacter terrae]
MKPFKSFVNQKKPKRSSINPFIRLVEDKKRVSKAFSQRLSLGTLEDIKFVKSVNDKIELFAISI